MGLFNLFRRRGGDAPEDPEALREALFGAVAAGDGRRVEALCRARRGVISAQFPVWRKVPEAVRHDPRALERYAQGLMATAEAFQRLWGDGSLFERLVGRPEDNPIMEWNRRLDGARALMEELRFAEAKEQLTNLLIDVRDLQQGGATCLPAMTHGVLGECFFGTGDVGGARSHFERALALCREFRDVEGVLAYLAALVEVHRYLGEPEVAADYAGRYGEALRAGGGGRDAEAGEWERRAARIRAGEPLNRVVAVMGEMQYEIEEMPTPPRNSRVQTVFVRNRLGLKLCEGLTREGERLGGEGKYYEALESFRAAARVDPYDPQPRYEAGATLMHLGRAAEAAAEFAATEALAPGWFRCRGDRWVAEEIAAGRVDPSVFVVLRLEDLAPKAMPAGERLGIVEQAIGRSPEVAPLHLLRAQLLAREGRGAEAAEACRAGLACVREDDVRTRLLVQLQLHEKSEAERVRLLREAVELREAGNVLEAAMAAIVLKTMGG